MHYYYCWRNLYILEIRKRRRIVPRRGNWIGKDHVRDVGRRFTDSRQRYTLNTHQYPIVQKFLLIRGLRE